MSDAIQLAACIDGIAVLAPGLPDWSTARSVLRGEQDYVAAPTLLPTPGLLPPAERRRASRVVRLVLALGREATAAAADVSTLATVFSASGADGHNCHALCEQLAGDDRQISPTRFHNSVHNAAAGYWGIASRAMTPCQVLAAYDASFGAGLLEALAQVAVERQTILLITYDSEYPEPLHAARPLPDCGGCALLLSPRQTGYSLARISVTVTREPAARLADVELEKLRTSIPALRCLPLLQTLATIDAGGRAVHLDYLPPLQLHVNCTPC